MPHCWKSHALVQIIIVKYHDTDQQHRRVYIVTASQLGTATISIFRFGCPQEQLEVTATPFGPRREKTCLRGFANNTGADQPAHPRSLISAFVIHVVESIICNLATGEISIFWLVPVAEETGLKVSLSETPKTGFVATRPI